ncbi:MAG TPA: hypothetical protein ENI11_04515, partial [Actinobacteria bacterium]|nr:hypothetical protein [Actinomycetota bacterium]
VLLNPVRILSFATISFFYVYVLSFYNKAKTDWRFLEALGVLRSKLSDSKIVVENPNRKPTFSFCLCNLNLVILIHFFLPLFRYFLNCFYPDRFIGIKMFSTHLKP